MADKNSIAIILWINDEEAGRQQGKYLNALRIPKGYSVELVEVIDAPLRMEAYEKGCSQTEAKYKIYLDAKTVMVNENILEDIISVFSKDASIGMMGLIGMEKIPTSGVCAWAKKRVGKAIDYKGEKFEKENFNDDYIEVMAVDGFWMATQYDLPWRTDLFHTDAFWDAAQCIEYSKAGYKVVVPKQKDYWCISNWAEQRQHDKASQEIFLDTYSKDVFPLVSIVIPTCNRPEYFKEALDSALSQTYRNIEIFITDNSHNTKTKELMAPYLEKYNNVKYEHHPDFESDDNWDRARSYNNPNAVYVNWLMDDDLFMPEKIAQMVDCYEQNEGIALVTSYREMIGPDGESISHPNWQPFFKETVRADGKAVGKELLMTGYNFIGEPTTALIKKEYMRNQDLGFTGTEGECLIVDYTTWLYCLQYGDLYYIHEPLSKFRIHEGQQQRNPETSLRGSLCMGMAIEYAWRNKLYLTEDGDFEVAVLQFLGDMKKVLEAVKKRKYYSDNYQKVKKMGANLLKLSAETHNSNGIDDKKTKERRPKFLIVSPPQRWGGPIVLHLLCRMLADYGYDAKVFLLRTDVRCALSRQEFLEQYPPLMNKKVEQIMDGKDGAVKGCELTNWPYVDDDTIVVYPDIIFGNPLEAKHVVRWFLNVNRYTGKYIGGQPYGKDDLFICYRDIFNDYNLSPNCRKVHLLHFDNDLYKRSNYGHREGSCFFIRKGSERADLPPTVPGIILDNLPEDEKVKVMNKCKYCYSYDTQTFYSVIAAICGCISIVVPEPGKKREDYRHGNEKWWGVAYGTSPEEIAFARNTQIKLNAWVEAKVRANHENVHKFLNYCKEHFQGRMDTDISW